MSYTTERLRQVWLPLQFTYIARGAPARQIVRIRSHNPLIFMVSSIKTFQRDWMLGESDNLWQCAKSRPVIYQQYCPDNGPRDAAYQAIFVELATPRVDWTNAREPRATIGFICRSIDLYRDSECIADLLHHTGAPVKLLSDRLPIWHDLD